MKYLNHDTFTDIVTFDSSDNRNVIEGDIYISIERVQDNARKYKVSTDLELHRVIIHGVLHLVGYSDKTPQQKKIMRKKEGACLSLRTFLSGNPFHVKLNVEMWMKFVGNFRST